MSPTVDGSVRHIEAASGERAGGTLPCKGTRTGRVDGDTVADTDERLGVDSKSVLGKAVLIFDAFGDDSPVLSFSEIRERTGLPRSTVHRVVEQLTTCRWLERVGPHYQLGTRLFELGGLVRRCSRLRDVALPFMEDLYEATHEVVHLGALDGLDVLYVEKISGHHAPALPSRVGGRVTATCTGLGKAMLAFAGDDVIDGVVRGGLPARTIHTITDPKVFRDELRTIRELGVAYDREEAVLGIKCVAVPIRGSGRAIAALSVTGEAPNINVDRLGPALKTAARGIWRARFAVKA